MLKAEIDPLMIRRKGSGAARDNSELGFHSFRHTFITMLTNAGVREEIRKKLSGHSDHGDVHARYTHHDLRILREAIDKLPSLSPPNNRTGKQRTA
jgi:integrase